MSRTFTTVEEDTLIASAKAGNLAAQRRLVLAYRPLVGRTLRRIGLTFSDDGMQEGIVALYEAVRDYDPERNRPFATFAALVVRRHLAAWHAREVLARITTPSSLDEPCPDSDVEDRHDLTADPHAVNPELRAGQREVIRAALARLTPHERAVFLRHVLCERSLTEIGEQRGVTRAAASKTYATAIGRMQ